jgi:hypothetical protein
MSPMASPGGTPGALTNTAAAQLYAGLDQLLVEMPGLSAAGHRARESPLGSPGLHG